MSMRIGIVGPALAWVVALGPAGLTGCGGDPEEAAAAADAHVAADAAACEGRGCDADAGLAGCLDDADCPAGRYCRVADGALEGVCAPGCRTTPDDCGAGRICDAVSHACADVVVPDVVCCRPDATCRVVAAGACDGEVREGAAGCDPNPCGPRPCDADAACPAGEYCDDGACAAGCRRVPDDCGNRRACDAAHACVDAACDDDADCADGYCQLEVQACRAACADDAACPNGFACEEGRCVRHGCVDDEGEPDDDAGRAVSFDEGAASAAARLCPLDADRFAVTLAAAGDRVRAELRCDGAADLALELVDAEGRRLAGANAEGCVESLLWPADGEPGAAGTFFVRVHGAAPAAGAAYDLSLFLLPSEDACAADAAEDDDDADAAATLLADGEAAEVAGRTLCPGDEDWFRFALGEGDGLTIDVISTGNPSGQNENLTFDLLGPHLALPVDPEDVAVLHPHATLAGVRGEEVLRLTLPARNDLITEGVWRLRVRGLTPLHGAAYDLRVLAERVAAPCRPDAEEPNDDQAAAVDLMSRAAFVEDGVLRAESPVSLEGLSRCLGDADWFHVRLAEGDRLTARLAIREVGGGALHLAIVDAAGVVVGLEAADVGPALATRSPALAGGDYYVRVDGARGARAPAYDLELVRTPGGAACGDDAYDAITRNDARDDATPIGVPARLGAGLCNGTDADWYTFAIDAAGRLAVDLRFRSADGDLDVALWREGGARPLAVGDGFDDDEALDVAVSPGRYFLEVSSFAGEDNDYDLELAFAADAACEGDALEPNGAFDEAVRADAPFAREGLWLCGRDEDWISVNQRANQTLTVHADFLRDDDGWITIDVYDADGGYVTTLEEPLDGQCAVLAPRPAATRWHFALGARNVDPADDTPDRVAYDLSVVAGDACADLEPLYIDIDWPRL